MKNLCCTDATATETAAFESEQLQHRRRVLSSC